MGKQREISVRMTLNSSNALWHVISGIGILFVASAIGSIVYILPLSENIVAFLNCIIYVGIAYGLIKLYCEKVIHIKLEDCRITKLKVSPVWALCALLLPVGVSCALMCTPGTFVANSMNASKIANIILVALFGAGISAGVVEEMVFRGFIMRMVEERWGRVAAVIVPSVIFGLLHIINIDMNLRDIILLLIAGTSVGIIFSLIVYQSGSIWSSALVHGMWNFIMIGDILDINIKHNTGAIFSYKMLSKSVILTGGSFGVESSIIAVIGYWIVIMVAFLLLHNEGEQCK